MPLAAECCLLGHSTINIHCITVQIAANQANKRLPRCNHRTPRRWLPPIHGQGCRSPAQLLTAFPSVMNLSASVVLVRLAPVHFWASHQGLLVRRCDALGTTISLQRNQPMHARRTYDRGRCWQLSAAGAYPWATGLHCALLASCGCVLASTVPRPTIGWHGCLNHFICIILRHSLAAESAGYRFPLGRQLTWGPCAQPMCCTLCWEQQQLIQTHLHHDLDGQTVVLLWRWRVPCPSIALSSALHPLDALPPLRQKAMQGDTGDIIQS